MDEFDRLPAVITIAEAAKAMRIGRNSCYAACRRGEVPSKRIGGRILINKASLLEMLSGGAGTPCSRLAPQ